MDEQYIPIDIQISKLGDWLTSRRHVNKDWPNSVLIIRQKINNAIQDMPEHPEVTKLLVGSYINYFHCLKVIEILEETEKDSKNIFGWYTSQRMKDWKEIVNLYGKNNVYLAEISQFLTRNVVYEVPSLRKQIAKLSQLQEMYEKKEISHAKTIAHNKDKYSSTCKQMGIKGENVEKELGKLAENFEDKFTKITERCKELESAVAFYSDFVACTTPSANERELELVKFISQRGNTTLYEFIHKEPPVSIEHTDIEVDPQEEEEEGDKGGGIDFDVEDDEELSTGEIDWESPENMGDEINFDIGVDDSGAGIEIESTGIDGGIAKGTEAMTILSNRPTREQFINELLELEGFLCQRKEDLKGEDNIVSMTHLASAPNSVQRETIDSMNAYIKTINYIIAEINSTKMQHLYLIRSSPRYVKRFAKSITKRLDECGRLETLIMNANRNGRESAAKQVELSKTLKLIIKRTVTLQGQIEKDISSKYSNRPVNLMGKV